MTAKRRLALLAAAISMVVAIVSAVSVIGREARLVDVLILFFSGFGSAASLLAALRSGRSRGA